MTDFSALRAIAFGASLGLAVGPLALLIVGIGLRRGFRRAAACALGVACADFTYALLALAAGAQIERLLTPWRTVFEQASGLILAALGLWLAASARRADDSGVATPRSVGFTGAWLLTLANPLTVLLFAAFSAQLPVAGAPEAVLGYAALIFLGSLPLQLGYAATGALLHRGLPLHWAQWASLASALAIVGFGLYGVWRAA